MTTIPTPLDVFGPDDPIPFHLTALDEDQEGGDVFGPDDPPPLRFIGPVTVLGFGPTTWGNDASFVSLALAEEREGHPEFDAVELDAWSLYAKDAELARALVSRLMDEDLPTERRASDDEDRRLTILSAEAYAGQAWAHLSHLIRTLKELAR